MTEQDNDLVFPNEVGRPIEAQNLIRRSFRPLLSNAQAVWKRLKPEAAPLPSIRFHDLRHTAATLLLGRGMHPQLVSEMLGHSQIAITLDLYSHVTPTMHREAANVMDSILQG